MVRQFSRQGIERAPSNFIESQDWQMDLNFRHWIFSGINSELRKLSSACNDWLAESVSTA